MSQYPVNSGSDIVEAVNYLLSGPTSIGQNFEGMSAVGRTATIASLPTQSLLQTFLTGLPIPGPFDEVGPVYPGGDPGTVNRTEITGGSVNTSYPIWNTLPPGLDITNIVPVTATGHRITVTIDPFQAQPTNGSVDPFVYGQQVVLSGITPSSFNGTYTVEFTIPFQAILVQDVEETWGVYVSGGVVTINEFVPSFNYEYQKFFTGNQAVVTVTGPTDRVFVSSQMNKLKVFTYTDVDPTVEGFAGIFVLLEINRYRAVQKTTLPDIGAGAIYASGGTAYNGYLWEFEETIVSVPSEVTAVLSPTTIDINNFGDVIYNNVIDNPGIGTYLYAFQISQQTLRDDVTPSTILIMGAQTTGVRSFTAQAIKR